MRVSTLLVGVSLSLPCAACDSKEEVVDAGIDAAPTPSLTVSVTPSEVTAQTVAGDGGAGIVFARFEISASASYAGGPLSVSCLDEGGNALVDWKFGTLVVPSPDDTGSGSVSKTGSSSLRRDMPVPSGSYKFKVVANAGQLSASQALTVLVP